MAEFHLVAQVSGSWYHTYLLNVSLSRLSGTLEYNRAIDMLLVTPLLFLQFKTPAVKMAYYTSFTK